MFRERQTRQKDSNLTKFEIQIYNERHTDRIEGQKD